MLTTEKSYPAVFTPPRNPSELEEAEDVAEEDAAVTLLEVVVDFTDEDAVAELVVVAFTDEDVATELRAVVDFTDEDAVTELGKVVEDTAATTEVRLEVDADEAKVELELAVTGKH